MLKSALKSPSWLIHVGCLAYTRRPLGFESRFVADLETDVLIIGAGLAGLSTALHFEGESLIVEAEDWVGGKARSEQIDGFTFDVTGHWLHLRDPGIRSMVLDLMGEDHFMTIERMSRVWSHGVYTKYPYQANCYGLPPEVIHECLMGAIAADRDRPAVVSEEDEPQNFADWCRFYFGEGIAGIYDSIQCKTLGR